MLIKLYFIINYSNIYLNKNKNLNLKSYFYLSGDLVDFKNSLVLFSEFQYKDVVFQIVNDQ